MSPYISTAISVVSLVIAVIGTVRAFRTERKVSRINVFDKTIDALKLLTELLAKASARHLEFSDGRRDYILRCYKLMDDARATGDKEFTDKIAAEQSKTLQLLKESEDKSNEQINELKVTFDTFIKLREDNKVDEFTIRNKLTGAYQIYYGMTLTLVGCFQILNGSHYNFAAWEAEIAAKRAAASRIEQSVPGPHSFLPEK